MEAANLKQSLEDAFTTLEALKNRLESSTASNSAPKVDPLPEGLQSAIARLSVELGKVAGIGDNARQEPPWSDDEYKSASKATELISGMSPKQFVGRKTVTFDQVLAHTDGLQNLKPVPSELPETPFRPPAMPSEAPLSALPHSTPGLPANTPMAVQVLAGLLGLSTNALASQPKFDTANQNDDPVLKLVKPSAAPTGKRAAAVRAAAAAAGIIARPRPQAVESGKRKTCNCKRSQCLKLYCDCFAAGGYCLPGCSCYNCSNREADAKTVEAQRNIILAKDPMAFDRKIEGESHKKGCRCKRSKCLKKYCECYNGGIRCNPEICQCEDCQNGTDATELEAYEERKQEEDMELENPVLAPMASRDIKNENTQPNVQTMSTKASKSEAAASQQQMMDGIVASQGAGDPSVVAWNAAADTAKAAAAAAAALFAPMAFPGSTTGMDADAIQLMHLVFAPAFTAAAAEIHATSIPAKPSQLNKDATVMASAQLVTDVLTPGSAMRVGPPALTSHLSDVNFTGGRGEEQDTATSPPLHNGGHPPVVATMTGGAHVARRADSFGCATGSDDESMIRKRPRRAASGGVQGAVAAAVSDWGLDIVSPPHKRSASLPGDMGRAPGLGGRRVGNALLRKALQNDAAVAATAQHKNDGDVADAVSALVSLNSQGQ